VGTGGADVAGLVVAGFPVIIGEPVPLGGRTESMTRTPDTPELFLPLGAIPRYVSTAIGSEIKATMPAITVQNATDLELVSLKERLVATLG